MSFNKRQFEKFYNQHFDKVYRFVFFRSNGNKEQTEDLVSEIFIKALRSFDKYNPSISKTSWLMTITRNHLINYWRDQKKTVPLLMESEEGKETEVDSFLLSQGLKDWRRKDDKRELAAVLLKLNENEREIVTLHYIMGYSYAEIGEMIGASEGATKVAAHRAIKKMREYI